MKPESQILHLRAGWLESRPTVTPIFQTAAFDAGSDCFYTRKTNPNLKELEEVLCVVEGAQHCCVLPSGMSGIFALLDLVAPNERIVLSKHLYGCTVAMFKRYCAIRHIGLEFFDFTKPEPAVFHESTKLVFLETPTNPFLYTIDLVKVRSAIDLFCPSAVLAVDNTWATGIYQRPLQHGAHVSLHSGTKYLSGHCDVMCGCALTDSAELEDLFRAARFYGGAVLSPESAWLVRRSLQTMHLRLARQSLSTIKIRDYLLDKPEVKKVYYPLIDGQQLTGYGGILFFEFSDWASGRYTRFRDNLLLFGSGTGMASVTSMVAQPSTGSHASLSEVEQHEMGITPDLIRLCIGLEHADDLTEALDNAFGAVRLTW